MKKTTMLLLGLGAFVLLRKPADRTPGQTTETGPEGKRQSQALNLWDELVFKGVSLADAHARVLALYRTAGGNDAAFIARLNAQRDAGTVAPLLDDDDKDFE